MDGYMQVKKALNMFNVFNNGQNLSQLIHE